MDVSYTSLDWLGTIFETMAQRLVMTAIVVALFGYAFKIGRTQFRRLDGRIRPVYRDVIGAVLFVTIATLAVGVVLGIWQQTNQVSAVQQTYVFSGGNVANLIVSAIILTTAILGTRFLRRLIQDVLGSAVSVTDHQQEVTYRLTQVTVYTMASITILGIWVEDIGAILVGAGFLGIVLGMAAQQTLGSLLAGFVLMFSRPFEIGDWVVVGDQHEGVVTDISIVDTRLRTADGEYIVLPNDVVGSEAVTNRSHSGRLRLEVEVGVGYDSDVERAARTAKEATENVDEVLSTPEPAVVTKSLADSSVVLGVRFWIDKPRAKRATQARTAVTNAIKAAFDESGVEIPFPQRELSGRVEHSSAEEFVEYDEASFAGDEPQQTVTDEADGPRGDG